MSDRDLVKFVLENVDAEVYYRTKFPEWDGNHNTNVKCCFHEDSGRPNLSININGRGGALCHSCGEKVGSIIHFEKLTATEGKNKIDDEQAASRIFGQFVRPVMAGPAEVEKKLLPWHTSLRGAPKVLACIKDEIQISKETAERFNLAWDNKSRRVTIPVLDQFGQLLNTRLYRLPSMRENEEYPKLLNSDGYGSPAEIFPIPQLLSVCSGKHKPEIVYWFSGERDTLLAWDRGIPSFCYTTGENVCRSEWADELATLNCRIGIVQDNDEAGEKGAIKRHALLSNSFIVKLPEELQGEKIKDFSDFIKAGGTAKAFLKLGDTKNEQPEPDDTEDENEENEDQDDHFPIPHVADPSRNVYGGEHQVSAIGRSPELLNRPITCRAVVSGKIDKTFSIPEIIQLGEHTYRIPISREMLQMVREKDIDIERLFQKWLNTKVKAKIVSRITVTEVEIIPMIQPGIDGIYVNQRCYYFGSGVECNKGYMMKIIPTTDMRTQETIGLITSVEPVSNVLDSYDFSLERCKYLNAEFNIGDQDPLACLKTLAHSVASNHTRIYNRDDVHMCILLSWICPLQFFFPVEGLQRGWLNALILGDTETGKSIICQKLTKLFECGVFINAESCSYVGLVGGAVKSSSGMFILRWGKIPLYNRQLVVVEELSGLTTQEISYMSEIRSAGVARYDKAGLTGETSAKTRLVCLSNVRGEGKSLGDYNTGVQAAQTLVGHNEDLARFDLILTATDEEVEGGVINQDRSEGKMAEFSTDEKKAFKELVMFAWSLKPEQIDFSVGAYRECLTQTLALCKEYHSSLPVFKAGSGRLKLARIALAIATIQFNWDFDRQLLVVTDKHVLAAAKVLHMIFRKPSFGYARYSKIQFNLAKVLHEDKVIMQIKATFKEKQLDFYHYVSHNMHFTKFDLSDALGAHSMFVERVISQMFLSNLLKKGEQRGEWQLSRAGRKWVEKMITEQTR